MSSPTANILHDEVTQRRQLSYVFTAKHHGADPNTARWSPDLTAAEEFLVFDTADLHDLSDEQARLYGILPVVDGDGLRELGTWRQQMAEYPSAREGEPWHGYPIGPLKEWGPENRRGEKWRPSKLVFEKMQNAGLLTAQQRKRLWKGDHV